MLPPGVTPFDTSSETPTTQYSVGYVDDWEEKFQQLETFKAIFGHARIRLKPWPDNHPIVPLARWANQQRVRVKNGTIRQYQVERLQALGFNTHGPLKKPGPVLCPEKLKRWVKTIQTNRRDAG